MHTEVCTCRGTGVAAHRRMALTEAVWAMRTAGSMTRHGMRRACGFRAM
jgi:hypothetical protein